MVELHEDIFSKYDIDVDRIYKGRGYLVAENTKDKRSVYKLYEVSGSGSRVNFVNEILNRFEKGKSTITGEGIVTNMAAEGEITTNIVVGDCIVRNIDGEIITEDELAEKFFLKKTMNARGFEQKNKEDILNGTKALANFHKVLSNMNLNNDGDFIFTKTDDLYKEFLRHNSELKRIRNYIRNLKRKNEFEYSVMKNIDFFIEIAEESVEQLERMRYSEYEKKATLKGSVCHGSYNYHNIIFDEKGNAIIINIENAGVGYQLKDLYFYIRKILEKHNWNVDLGKEIIDAYSKEKELTNIEIEMLVVLLKYPEKYWKVLNQYYNTSKSRLFDKNVEKMNVVCSQQKKKELFLSSIRDCYSHI